MESSSLKVAEKIYESETLKNEKFELLKDEGIINSTNIEKRKSNAKI